ncbi:MAG: hypothetical protein V3V16_04675 [Melioribacteraceae bacterium]
MKKRERFLKISIYIFLILVITSCGTSNPVNDFFGIKMHPLDEQSFEIVGYSVKDGISYKNSIMMEPKLSAWAEVSINDVKIIIENKTDKEIPLNYNVDDYVIVTDEKEYRLEKGDRIKYTSRRKIKPNSKLELSLGLPTNLMQSLTASNNYTDTDRMFNSVVRDYNKAGTKLDIAKENIKYILIKFGHSATIVLKAVPEKRSLSSSLN